MAEKLALTRAAFLAAEALAPTRSSFHAGEAFSMGDGSWRLTDHGPGGTVHLDAAGAQIAVDEVYAKVDLVGGPARDAQPTERPPLEP